MWIEDAQQLHDLNLRIADEENAGNVTWLGSILAPQMAFQRADPAKTIDDRASYLRKVAKGGDRRTIAIESIDIFGKRAVVTCLVRSEGRVFHNIRLYVKRASDDEQAKESWLLLGWANEPQDESPQ